MPKLYLVADVLDRIFHYLKYTVLPNTDKRILKFKITAYKSLSEKIKRKYFLSEKVSYDDLISLDGVSEKMKEHIKDFLSMKYDSELTSEDKLLSQLLEIKGIGEERAKELVKRIKKVSDLKKKDIIDTLPIESRYHILYPPLKLIPHETILRIEKVFKIVLKGIKFEIVGSFRRKKPFSRDIDIMVTSSNDAILSEITELIKTIPKVRYHVYSDGKDKISGILELPNDVCVKLDFFRTEKKYAVFMLLYATGSKEFNLRMRGIAKKKGFLLNQKGLFFANDKTKSPLGVTTEKDIFTILGMTYIPPSER